MTRGPLVDLAWNASNAYLGITKEINFEFRLTSDFIIIYIIGRVFFIPPPPPPKKGTFPQIQVLKYNFHGSGFYSVYSRCLRNILQIEHSYYLPISLHRMFK